MSEPKRWLDDDPPELLGQLMKAASRERPPEASLTRSLAALGISAGATSTAVSAGAASGMASAVKATSAAVPWLKFAVLLGVASGTGGAWVATHPTPTRAPLPVQSAHPLTRALPATTTEAARARVVESVPAPSSAPPLPSAFKSSPAPVTRLRETENVSPPVDAEHLTEEVAAVDRARALVTAGRGAEALAALDAYEHGFPVRRFAPEALYLRMEALLLDGNRGAAEQVAARLVARYPRSPQAPRARQILGTTNP
jgi:hypothetical protein